MSSPRPAKRKLLKERLLAKFGARCNYCFVTYKPKKLTIDHVKPLSKGGTWDEANLCLACLGCNQKKADKGVAGFVFGRGASDYFMEKQFEARRRAYYNRLSREERERK
jgi:5-methylcytosine-specific restriction endonuclease McrA